MKLAEVSIRRPVFATMVVAAIVVFGAFLYGRLAVDMMPDVDLPVVTVTTVYPGASPETMESQVAEPIEEALGTLGGVESLRSICLESVSQVVIELDLDADLDVAVQDVRDRIASIARDLPDDAEEPQVSKLDLGAAPVLELAVTSDGRDPAAVASFVEDVLAPQLRQVGGVGQVEAVGSRRREVHVYLDPTALRSLGLSALEVIQALGAQNVEVPGGRIERDDEELVLRTDARATSPAELEDLVLATIPMGGSIRLGDVARVVDGLEEERSVAELDGRPAVGVIVRKQSGQNTVAVAEAVREALPRIQALAPEGISISVVRDGSTFIRASIESVELDLVIGALLAVLIILLFLRDLRATLISALALPTSVIGTFAFVYAMGFTINLLTTLALSLSIGILIDDAIVVIENISRRRTALGEGRREAALRGTSEIGLAVLATTLSIVAVFLPVAFTQGMVGRFLYQFGTTVAFAVLLSLFVSFTLTPMLASRILGGHGRERGPSAWIGRVLDGLDALYRRMIAWVLRHRWVTLGLAAATLAATVALTPRLGFELIPQADRGKFNVRLELPPGASLARTAGEARRIAEQIRRVPGVTSTFVRVGGGVLGQVNSGLILVSLVPTSERGYSEAEAIEYLRGTLAGAADLAVTVEPLGIFDVSHAGRMAPVEVILQGDDIEALDRSARRLVERLEATEGFADVESSLRAGAPELHVEVDRARAADLGVLGAPVAVTVRTLVAGQVATRLDAGGERYDVRVQLPPDLRTSADTLERAQVRAPTKELIDIGAIARVVERRGATRIDRYDRQRQVTVYANLEQGLSQSEALAVVERALARDLPPNVSYTFGGQSARLGETTTNMLISLLLAIVCIYMVLAAQFESFLHPFTIMVSLPFSAIGAIGALLLTGSTMSIMAMIGFIMLMGLVTKNAILLVDFANQRKAEGMSVNEALVDAGATRLRPILMTTAAMIFGMLPAAIGHGDGGEIRSGMGIAVIGGLLTSTLLTLLVVPVVYTLIDGLGARLGRLAARLRPKAGASEPRLASAGAAQRR